MTRSVTATEYGQVRVFRLSDALAQSLKNEPGLAPLETALGVVIAQPDDVQIVGQDSLAEMGLAQFLVMAYDADPQAIAKISDLQDPDKRSYAIMRSGAFGGAAVTLADSSDATLVATLREGGADAPSLEALQSDSAKGSVPPQPTKPPKSDARIGGMIAIYVLLFLFALVGLMIWIAS